ncbi:TetR family transcriptional regulator [Streptomyces sp. SL13]|uniref:TetR family transcriptional regulator n=1 Tax=Streptantibioticus silvisoli TaxID=2705255 RepID=A0AA90K712_9ACTN|nr:TetR family transcriptional regulator [Streptantibioticus silvisoli]MDI5963398.1 TetR family transcriptional regulator [Streptantibioticus silvisoli]MDI5967797.1 TetR family transcriptional regulator [Streptantibioticus silvisoli]
MAGDASATRRRLLDAAAAEFATYGIAGARVDRIAAAARSNKAQIYHYYGSKDGLFEAVFDELVVETVANAPIDAHDLPEYAGRLFDGYAADPTTVRLATWYRLEHPSGEPPATVTRSMRHKIDAIARAQADGVLPTRFTAAELLALVLNTACLWAAAGPELTAHVDDVTTARRRQVVVDAVRLLLAD